MRPERITLKQAQARWDKIASSIMLVSKKTNGLTLPSINMTTIFAGRQSMTASAVAKEVAKITGEWERVESGDSHTNARSTRKISVKHPSDYVTNT